jgi:peptidyl-prolyl cis-trans isomerase SurA
MRILSALALPLLLAVPALAQLPTPPAPGGEEMLDRVVAVVGDTTLLLSEVQEEIGRLRASGQQIPSDPAGQEALFRDILRAQVDNLVILQAAKQDKIEVNDREVAPLVEQEIQQVQQRFGSEAALQRALAQSGLTLEEYRRVRTAQNRAQAIAQRYIQKRLQSEIPPRVSEAEVRTFFEAQRTRLGERPATVSFEQVLIRPAPSDSAKAAARREAEKALEELRAGGDFEVLAKRYSDDPGSKERGGDLGWFRQGSMVRPFEQVAFALRPGMVSGIVETQFGFHIIKLEKIRGGERQARHILVTPEITDADRAAARARADSVAAAVRSGARVADLQLRYETPADQRIAEDVPMESLPPAYGPALASAQPGAVVGPFEHQGGPEGSGWAVVRLSERKAAGPYTLEDVRERVVQRLQEQKLLADVIEDLRRATYVNILI